MLNHPPYSPDSTPKCKMVMRGHVETIKRETTGQLKSITSKDFTDVFNNRKWRLYKRIAIKEYKNKSIFKYLYFNIYFKSILKRIRLMYLVKFVKRSFHDLNLCIYQADYVHRYIHMYMFFGMNELYCN